MSFLLVFGSVLRNLFRCIIFILHVFIYSECLPWVSNFTFLGGGENKKGRGRAASYCHSDYILLQGKRSSGTQVLPSLYLPSQGRMHLSNVLKKTLMVSRGLGLEMSDAGLFFPESTHSLVGEANMGIISIIILPARMKYVNQRYK